MTGAMIYRVRPFAKNHRASQSLVDAMNALGDGEKMTLRQTVVKERLVRDITVACPKPNDELPDKHLFDHDCVLSDVEEMMIFCSCNHCDTATTVIRLWLTDGVVAQSSKPIRLLGPAFIWYRV